VSQGITRDWMISTKLNLEAARNEGANVGVSQIPLPGMKLNGGGFRVSDLSFEKVCKTVYNCVIPLLMTVKGSHLI
jgi:hypothetical protein